MFVQEATRALMEQLQKAKAEEKESKRRMKEEKARSKAAARMQTGDNCKMSSSSSSSSSSESSSDSECGEVVDMNSLKRAKSGLQQQVIEEETSAYPAPIIPTIPTIQIDACNAALMPAEELAEQPSSSSNVDDVGEMNPSCLVVPNKIEVCMGGKCKKSGAGALLEEFQRVVGMESAVSGCKCMGKCRDGPNVKVVNASDRDMEKNSLCIGVGLEDVNVIVANFLGEHQLGGLAAAT